MCLRSPEAASTCFYVPGDHSYPFIFSYLLLGFPEATDNWDPQFARTRFYMLLGFPKATPTCY